MCPLLPGDNASHGTQCVPQCGNSWSSHWVPSKLYFSTSHTWTRQNHIIYISEHVMLVIDHAMGWSDTLNNLLYKPFSLVEVMSDTHGSDSNTMTSCRWSQRHWCIRWVFAQQLVEIEMMDVSLSHDMHIVPQLNLHHELLACRFELIQLQEVVLFDICLLALMLSLSDSTDCVNSSGTNGLHTGACTCTLSMSDSITSS